MCRYFIFRMKRRSLQQLLCNVKTEPRYCFFVCQVAFNERKDDHKNAFDFDAHNNKVIKNAY
jgi:hypothetical protein